MANAPLRLVENITLLQKVNPGPAKPSKNALPLLESGERALKLRHERDIADCLAFVSACSNDPTKVMALCIEEKPNYQGLIVSVAANTGNLRILESGILGIVSILEKEARGPLQENYAALVQQIVRHGRPRLLRRVSSKHTPFSPKELKAPVATRLKDCLAVFNRTHQNTAKVNKSLQSWSRKFEDEFNQLEQLSAEDSWSDAGQQLLMSMLSTANSICNEHKHDLIELLEQIPSENSWSQNDKEKFMLRLQKVAQYISAAKHLLQAARTFPILQSIEVRSISVAPLSLATHLQCTTNLTLTGLLNQYLNGHGSRKLKATMKKLQQQSQCSLTALQSEVRNRVCQIKYKVHAEIQLLFDYEIQGSKPLKPRVIVSSKSACFLCDLFLKRHGIFHTPRTHGRLYDTWILPDLAALQVSQKRRTELRAIVQEFDIAIEQILIHSIEGGAVSLCYPNESDIFSVAPFTPSEVSAISTKTVTPGNTTPIGRNIVLQNVDIYAPASSLRNSSTCTGLETAQPPLMTEQATLCDTIALQTPPGPYMASSSPSSSSGKRDSIWSESANGRRITEESSSQPPETAASPITPTMPTAQTASLLPLLDDQNTPEPPKRREIRPPEIILLEQGTPSRHTFTSISSPLRLHTPRIHIELSYAHAWSIVAQRTECLYSYPNEEPMLAVEAEWLAPAKMSMETTSSQAIDLASEWGEMEAPEGIMYSSAGLLLRKGRDFIAIRAKDFAPFLARANDQ